MANTLMEQSKVGILVEGTWGTAPAGNAMLLEVASGEWLRDVVEEYRDEMVRNVLARDFGSVPTVAHGEGTLSGAFTAIMPVYFLDSVLGGTEAKGNLHDTTANTTVDTLMDIHTFTVGANPRTMVVQQSDAIVDELYLGMMVNSFTLRFNSGEGAVEWEADLIGKGRVFPATAKTVADNTMVLAANRPPKPLVGAMAAVDINGTTTAKVLDFEMVISREIEMGYGAGNTRRPNIRRTSAPQITFRATAELQLESDVQKFSSDPGVNTNAQAATVIFDEPNATFFDGHLDYWHVRIATDPDVTLALTPLPTTAVADAATASGTLGDQYVASTDSNECVIDIYLDRVTYGSDPIVIDRSEKTATIVFNGTALYETTDSRLGVFRVMNRKLTAYTNNDV